MIAVALIYQILLAFAIGSTFIRVLAEAVQEDRPDVLFGTLVFLALAVVGTFITFQVLIASI